MLTLITGLFGDVQLHRVYQAPWVEIPWIVGMISFSFRWSLLTGFLIVSATGALKTMGNLTMCQKVNDAGLEERNNSAKTAGEGR